MESSNCKSSSPRENMLQFGSPNCGTIIIHIVRYSIQYSHVYNKIALWKLKINAILRKDNSLVKIEGGPTEVIHDKWKEVDDNSVANLHLAMADSVLSSITKKKTAKEIWDVCIKLYEVKSLQIFLNMRLCAFQMSEPTLMTNHINTLNTPSPQLTSPDFKVAKNEVAEILLQSLIYSYDKVVINITNNNPEPTIEPRVKQDQEGPMTQTRAKSCPTKVTKDSIDPVIHGSKRHGSISGQVLRLYVPSEN
ncbi:hypothetical protein Lal_00022738 [Lupinus albus]|nr:hypothetical protein Lal_00022738 [Lupinus albus]